MFHQLPKPMPTPKEKICDVVRKIMTQVPNRRACSLNSASRKAGVNLYKYSCNQTMPRLDTMIRYCESMDLDPGWMIWLCQACVMGILEEEQLFEILNRWPEVSSEFDSLAHVALGKALQSVRFSNSHH